MFEIIDYCDVIL